MPLNTEQREALEQLWAVTASESDASRERDERLLRENGFDVQRTVEQIFTMGPVSPSGPSRPRSTDAFDFDAANLDMGPRPPAGARRLSGTARRTGPAATTTGLNLWSAITLPVRLVIGILSGTWYFLVSTFMPISFLRYMPRFLLPPSSASGPSTRPPRDPTTTSLSFVRDLEQFTGCSATSGTMLDFWVGPYREFLSDVRKQAKIGMVVLVCGEHEDDEEFKRDVVCDPELVRFIKEKEIMVWGADIRSREGYQASQTLLATTYPSLTFMSTLPGSGGAAPKLTILTALSGPPSTTTSTSSIMQLITTSIIPRTSAFLSRVRRERSTLEESRHLRAEQDRAFREAEARDREKSQRLKEQERQAKLAAEKEEQARQVKANAVENRKAWRRYARKHLLPPSAGPIRVALRVPASSERNIRNFYPGPSTLPLFIYAETLLIPAGETPEGDPDSPPSGYTPPYDFRVVTNYPRKEIGMMEDGGEAVWDTVKQAGGALFAEKKEDGTWGEAESGESDDEADED